MILKRQTDQQLTKMESHCKHPTCSCAPVSSVSQMLHEMDFDRGPWSAALYGDLSRLKYLLNKESFKVDSLDSSGYSSLHYAARAGHFEIVKYLHSAGADINLPTRAGHSTPLHRAACQGHIIIVQFLLDNGANVRIQDSDGCTVLHRCAERNFKEICLLLMSRNSELVNVFDSRQRLPKDCCTDLSLQTLLENSFGN